MTVYVDLLFLVNLALNAWALWVTAKLVGISLRAGRLFWASLCGAIFAFGSLTPWSDALAHPASKLLLAAAMVYLAFRPQKPAKVLHLLAWFLLVSFATAGVVLGLYALLLDKVPTGQVLTHGVLPLWLLLTAVAVLGVTGRHFLGNLQNRLVHVANRASLMVGIGRLEFTLDALVDSGNQLSEPLSGRPVVVVALAAVSHLLPPELVRLSQANSYDDTELTQLASDEWARRIRFVPYHTVANPGGILLGVRVDQIQVSCNGRMHLVRDITLAICPTELSLGDNYQALVPLRLLPTKADYAAA